MVPYQQWFIENTATLTYILSGQIYGNQDYYPQSQSCMFKPTAITSETNTPLRHFTEMQIPKVGPEWDKI